MASQSKRQVCREIQDTLAAALAARGVTARLTLTDQCATLKADERSAEVALADLPHVWPQLPRGERSKRIGHLVRQLTSRWDQGRTSLWWTTVVPLFVIAAVTLGLGIPLVRGAVPKETLGPRPVSTSIVQRATHAAGVCETTRSRVMRGATAGVADHEGWLVELSLVTAASDVLPPTGEFFSPLPSDHLAVSWNGSPELGKITDGHVELVERRSNSKRETKFVLHGGYVRSYFAESERAEWQRLATSLAKHVGAQFGGLYARCAHQTSHHIGSWYVGQNDGAAAAALVYYDAAFSAAPVLASGFGPQHGESAQHGETPPTTALASLSAIVERAEGVSREQLAVWLSKDDGQVSHLDGRTMLQFPYRDSNRAARSSIRVARQLGIAKDR